MSDRARHYPAPAPSRPEEGDEEYTLRLLSQSNPYDHSRFRQCSLGYHTECTQRFGNGGGCQCPCHFDCQNASEEANHCAAYWAARKISELYYLPAATGGKIFAQIRAAVGNGTASSFADLRTLFRVVYGCVPSDSFLIDVASVMNHGIGRDGDIYHSFLHSGEWAKLVDEAQDVMRRIKGEK